MDARANARDAAGSFFPAALVGLALVSGSGCLLTQGVWEWAAQPVCRVRAEGVVGTPEKGERVLFRFRECTDRPDGWYAFEVPAGWQEKPTRASRWGADIREIAEPVESLVRFDPETRGRWVKRLDFPAVVRWGRPPRRDASPSPTKYGVIYVDHTRERRGRFAAEVFGYDAARRRWVHLGGVPLDGGRKSAGRATAAVLMTPVTVAADFVAGFGYIRGEAPRKPPYKFELPEYIAKVNEVGPPPPPRERELAAKEAELSAKEKVLHERLAARESRRLRKTLAKTEEAREAVRAELREGRAVAAARLLLGYGAHAKPAVPGLHRMLKDPHPSVRLEAAWVLCSLCPLEAPGIVGELLRDRTLDAKARRRAASLIAGEKSYLRFYVPFRTADKKVHKGARNVVSTASATGVEDEILGDEELAAGILSLAEALQDEDATVRRDVADALGGFGVFARDGVPGLVGALEDDDVGVRGVAATALGRIGPAAREAVPALRWSVRQDTSRRVRTVAATALGRIGPAAREAVPALRMSAREDTSQHVRRAAAKALRSIQELGEPGGKKR